MFRDVVRSTSVRFNFAPTPTGEVLTGTLTSGLSSYLRFEEAGSRSKEPSQVLSSNSLTDQFQ